MIRACLAVVASVLLAGCAAGRFQVEGPLSASSQSDLHRKPVEGFRYYLPKPYLVVTNMKLLVSTEASASAQPKLRTAKPSRKAADGQKPKEGEKLSFPDQPATEGSVDTVQLLWLPDFSQEYAVSVRGGHSGSFKGSLKLANGWMLEAVDEESDAKTAETLNAVSGLLGNLLSASGLPAAAAKGFAAEAPTKRVSTPFLYLFEIDTQNRRLIRVDASGLQKVLEGKPSDGAKTSGGTGEPKEVHQP